MTLHSSELHQPYSEHCPNCQLSHMLYLSVTCIALHVVNVLLHTLVWCTGVKRSRRTNASKGFHKDDKDEAECAICHLYLHVSGLECDCCPGRRVCLHHADNLCECDPSRWRLVYRYSLQDLNGILKRVSAHIPQDGTLCLLTHTAALCTKVPANIVSRATLTQHDYLWYAYSLHLAASLCSC